jgi:hypothetical protein
MNWERGRIRREEELGMRKNKKEERLGLRKDRKE